MSQDLSPDPDHTAVPTPLEPPRGVTPGEADFVVVANRLPVDVTIEEDGSITSERAPGGLVTALAPLMRETDGAWVGWAWASRGSSSTRTPTTASSCTR